MSGTNQVLGSNLLYMTLSMSCRYLGREIWSDISVGVLETLEIP